MDAELTPEEQARLQQIQERLAPRPVPTGWRTQVVPFVNEQQQRKHMIAFALMTPTGEHVTFWTPGDLTTMTDDLRRAAKEASVLDASNPLWTPPASPNGLILPPNPN